MNRSHSQNGLGRLFNIDPTNLERGQAVFVDFVDIPEIVVDTRDTLTQLWSGTPTEKEIQKVQETRGDRSPGGKTHDLDSEEREVMDAIQSYIDREEKLPSQNKVIQESSFSAGKTLETLIELSETVHI